MITIQYFEEKIVPTYETQRKFKEEKNSALEWSVQDRSTAARDGIDLAEKIELQIGTTRQANATLYLPNGDKRTAVAPVHLLEEIAKQVTKGRLAYEYYKQLFSATTRDNGPGMP